MAYNSELAKRLEDLVNKTFADSRAFEENTMMVGFGYMLNGNMVFGVFKDWLILRVGKETAEELLIEQHVKPMDITGRVMRAWVMVSLDGLKQTKALKNYCSLAIDFVDTLPAK